MKSSNPIKNILGGATFLVCMAFFCSGAGNSSALKTRFQKAMNTLREQYHFPGMTVACMLPDGTVETAAVGLADMERHIPMTPCSPMLAASIGKMFVGATMVALSREGVLHLDDYLSKWLRDRPWFGRLPNHKMMTLRHLLNHSAGIPNHVEEDRFKTDFSERWKMRNNPFSPEDLVAYILDQQPLFKPGEGWYYSDTGYILVGLVIEKVTGNSYYEEIIRRFIKPLHLTSTVPSDRRELDGLAAGYLASDNPFNLPEKTTVAPGVLSWHPGIEWTGGGLMSNSKDLAVWAKVLFEGKAMEGNYVPTLLQSVPVSSESPNVRYGMGVGIKKNGKFGTTYGHGGWIPGYCSSLRYYPDFRLAIAFQINTDVGIVHSSTPVIEEVEMCLAQVAIDELRK